MKVTVSLCSDWQKRLTPDMVEAMTPIIVDPIGRNGWVCDRAHSGYLREICKRDAGTHYVFEAAVSGFVLTEGECRDQKGEYTIIVRRDNPVSPTGQVILVSSKFLDWAATAMSHILLGEHFAVPFAALAFSRSSGLYREMLNPLERLMLVSALFRNDWCRKRTAAELGVCRQTLYKRMLALDISESFESIWRTASTVERAFSIPTVAVVA